VTSRKANIFFITDGSAGINTFDEFGRSRGRVNLAAPAGEQLRAGLFDKLAS
jgi:hypothetical protein